MMRIDCPWCGVRGEEEFRCAGELGPPRPADPQRASDAAWTAYRYERDNRCGLQLERWQHRDGCGQWFKVARHLVSHEIVAAWGMSDPPPPAVAGAGS